MVAAGVLYTLATLIRGERWHRILELTGVKAGRSDCYALTTVGYMGNNVLPALAPARRCEWCCWTHAPRAGKRTLLGTIVAERILDVLVLEPDPRRPPSTACSTRTCCPPTAHWLFAAAEWPALGLAVVAFSVLRRRGALERLRDFARPMAGAPRAMAGKQGLPLLAGTAVLWLVEGAVYLAVARAVELDISMTGAMYLVALTNFVAAIPAAPGSIGTFDAAVAFGARALGGTGSVVTSYLLLLRFVLYVPITIVGLRS